MLTPQAPPPRNPGGSLSTTRVQGAAPGLLVPVGGGYADVYPGIVAAMLERAQNGHVKITVLPTPYAGNAERITPAELELNMRDAERRRLEIEEACQRAAPAPITCRAEIAPIFVRADAENKENLPYFGAGVTAVFILGGDQGVAMQTLIDTPVEQALATPPQSLDDFQRSARWHRA